MVHTPPVEAPTELLNIPGAQVSQEELVWLAEYRPMGQVVHDDAPVVTAE